MSELQLHLEPEAQAKIDRLIDWIKTACPVDGEFDLDTDLIEDRIVTSLQFVELVMLVEELREQEISEEERDLDRFRTLRSIATHYF